MTQLAEGLAALAIPLVLAWALFRWSASFPVGSRDRLQSSTLAAVVAALAGFGLLYLAATMPALDAPEACRRTGGVQLVYLDHEWKCVPPEQAAGGGSPDDQQ